MQKMSEAFHMDGSEVEPYHVTIEVVNRQCKGLRMLGEFGIQKYALVDIRGLPGGMTKHLVKMPWKQMGEIPGGVLAEIHSSGGLDGGASGWFESDGCDICKAVLSNDSFLLSGRHTGDDTVVYTFVTPSFEAFKKIVSRVEGSGFKPKILEVEKFKSLGKVLTEKQEAVLWLALKMGFFDFPRKIGMSELSEKLGIGLSTLSEITRRGIRRLLEAHFEA